MIGHFNPRTPVMPKPTFLYFKHNLGDVDMRGTKHAKAVRSFDVSTFLT